MRITGFCRFSWFGISDTGRAVATEEDAQRLLYDPARMAVRFHLFEHLAAPSIRWQTDSDFDFFVITSDIMPEAYHLRLERIAAAVPRMKLVVTSRRDLSRVLKPLIDAAGEGGTRPTLNFRLDDDDAVAVSYVERLREAGLRMQPPAMISFPKGMFLFSDGQAKVGTLFKDHIAIGLARLNAPGDLRDPFRIQHRKEPSRVPSYMDPRFPAYIYTAHANNNTGIGAESGRAIRRYLNAHPELREATSTPAVDAGLAGQFPFLTPEGLRRVLQDCATAGFRPEAPLPPALTEPLPVQSTLKNQGSIAANSALE